MGKSKLTILVITMNRSEQLIKALDSCLHCELYEDTKFVIIDNASTDNTEEIVKKLMNSSGYEYYYEKLDQNLGVGGGRNYAYKHSSTEYSYVLDDDALIDFKNNPNFFKKAIEIMDKHEEIVTLTTQIYDKAWQKDRVEKLGSEIYSGIFTCKVFCGGSHFLRNEFFNVEPYLSNKYGFEELPTSLKVLDQGKINAFAPELLVIHCPKINKWTKSDSNNNRLYINECAVPYAIKKMMYPHIFHPIIYGAYKIRCIKHLKSICGGLKEANIRVKETMNKYPINYKIKITTVLKMLKEFGSSIF